VLNRYGRPVFAKRGLSAVPRLKAVREKGTGWSGSCCNAEGDRGDRASAWTCCRSLQELTDHGIAFRDGAGEQTLSTTPSCRHRGVVGAASGFSRRWRRPWLFLGRRVGLIPHEPDDRLLWPGENVPYALGSSRNTQRGDRRPCDRMDGRGPQAATAMNTRNRGISTALEHHHLKSSFIGLTAAANVSRTGRPGTMSN